MVSFVNETLRAKNTGSITPRGKNKGSMKANLPHKFMEPSFFAPWSYNGAFVKFFFAKNTSNKVYAAAALHFVARRFKS